MRNQFPIPLLVFRLWVAAAAFPVAMATTFNERPFPASVQDASGIVRGKIGMSYSDWGIAVDSTRRLYTYYELQLTETLKGEAKGNTIILRELGGSKDGVAMEISGAARFERGEDVVVMIGGANSDGSYDVRGLMMAKYTIERDAEGKETLRGPGISGAGEHAHSTHQDAEQDGQKGPPAAAKKRSWTLDELRDLIREQASAGNQVVKPGSSATPQTSVHPEPLSASDLALSGPSKAPTAEPASSLQSPADESVGQANPRGSSRVLLLLGIGTMIGAVLYLLNRLRARR